MTLSAYILNFVKLLRDGPLIAFAIIKFLNHVYYVSVSEVILLFLGVAALERRATTGRRAPGNFNGPVDMSRFKSARSLTNV